MLEGWELLQLLRVQHDEVVGSVVEADGSPPAAAVEVSLALPSPDPVAVLSESEGEGERSFCRAQ